MRNATSSELQTSLHALHTCPTTTHVLGPVPPLRMLPTRSTFVSTAE